MVLLLALVVTATTLTFWTVGLVGSAHASAGKKGGVRAGGPVRTAWPKRGKPPRNIQARWLARQVGAIKPRPCAREWRKARRLCRLRAVRGGPTATMSTLAGDPGSPAGTVARIAGGAASARNRAVAAGTVTLPLQLVRSYEIPADDPSYNRLLDWSWTYDSAVSAAAFAATGDRANSAQLLDQLAALQYTDGSLEIAFNTATGEGASVFRSGTVAWLGLAATTYDKAFGATSYLDTERRAADYLLTLSTESGLIRGGPDVKWISTQHNLISYVFLTRLGDELASVGDTAGATRYRAAAATIAAAINKSLLVVDSSGARFVQGVDDETQALDVQALGAMYLQGTGQPELAAQVLAYSQKAFAVGDRSVDLSKEAATYNMTYFAAGSFSGYAPYVGSDAPDVRWAEGSAEMRLATTALGQDTSAIDKSIASWASITEKQGPLQADRAVKSDALGGVEYHVWPASTAAAWTVLAQSAPVFFAAPQPPTTSLITGWTKVRGGNLFTTYPDGRVEMTAGAGERRAFAASKDSDYTVTSKATLLSGAGYGIYVRAKVDSAGKLTGYCIQIDHAYGQIVVRQLQNDAELSVPLARVNVPTGFSWYGVSHTVGVTVNGNAMSVTLDGGQLISLPDLATAMATSVKNSYSVTQTYTQPATGGYGLRAWSDGLVSLQQMTVGAPG